MLDVSLDGEPNLAKRADLSPLSQHLKVHYGSLKRVAAEVEKSSVYWHGLSERVSCKNGYNVLLLRRLQNGQV